MTTSANPSVYGQSVTFTATVRRGGPGSGKPTGTVTFYDGTTTLGTAKLSGGAGKLTIKTLAIGTHSITAVYGGDGNFTTSTSTALNQTVNQDATTTTISSSVDPSVYGQAVTFTATSWPRRVRERDADGDRHLLRRHDDHRHGYAHRRRRRPSRRSLPTGLALDHRGVWRRSELHDEHVDRP